VLLHTRHPGVQGRCFERQPREGLGSQPRLLALQPSFPTATAQPRPSSRSWAVPQGPAVPSSTQPAQGTGRVLPAPATPRVSGHPSQAQRLLLLHGHIPRIVMGSGGFPSRAQRSGGGWRAAARLLEGREDDRSTSLTRNASQVVRRGLAGSSVGWTSTARLWGITNSHGGVLRGLTQYHSEQGDEPLVQCGVFVS